MNTDNNNDHKQYPVISIIIPVYNLELSVGNCLKSLLAQTYTSLEIILIDDGSTDKSLTILQNYAQCDSRISVLHQSNAGAEAARYAGIKKASGFYLMFVDGDDMIFPDCIENLKNIAIQEDSDIVVGDYIRYLDRFGFLKRREGQIIKNFTINKTQFKESYYSGFFGKDKYALLYVYGKKCTKLYKRSFLNENLPTPNGLKYGEDQLFNCHVFPLAQKISFLAKDVYIYKFGGVTAHPSLDLFNDILRFHSLKLAMPICEEWQKSEMIVFRQNVKTYLATLAIAGHLSANDMSQVIEKMNNYPFWIKSLNEEQNSNDCFFTALRDKNAELAYHILSQGTLLTKIMYKLRRIILKLAH